jgi:hypothetical protein
VPAKITDLPAERQKKYNRQRNSLILRYRISGRRKGGVQVD